MGKETNDHFFPTAAPDLSLDNIEQLGTRRHAKKPKKGERVAASTEVERHEVLKKRARAKHFAKAVARALYLLDSPLKTSYASTVFQCAEVLAQNGTKITSRYCGHRWCVVCNRIKTAKQLKGYEKPLSELKNKYLVTLTLPNVEGYKLENTIVGMTNTVQDIQQMFQARKRRGNQNWQIVGVRKLECTFNVKSGLFHPHFHFIIEGKEAARSLITEWLRRVPVADAKAQDMRETREGYEMELFKYFAKLVTKIDGKNATLAVPLDTIFQSMKGKRTFQPMGGIKKVSEEVEELRAVEVEGIEAVEAPTLWQWHGSDWVNMETGEARTGYVPSAQMEELTGNIYNTVDDLRAGRTAILEHEKSRKVAPFFEPVFPDINLSLHRESIFAEMDSLERERAKQRAAQVLPFAEYDMQETG